MENDLLDISGEDEDNWLLKNTPKKGVTSFAGGSSRREKSYFDSSPLEIPRSSRALPPRPPFSPIGRVTGNSAIEQPSSSVDTENLGKENTSGNKVELPKLSVERQQMKKKKKNAGFNLRKSLAWDRAFSTEEGVLDSEELSKITEGLLPAIQEEFRESTSASKCTSVSPGLQALEENLFNDLPVNSKKREKKFVSGTVSKYASPSKAQSSLAQKKVTSAQDLKSGSKRSGCPRPPPSSSLKRPANVHTTTQRSRELGYSKVSTTRSDSLPVANNMKRTTQSPSKPKISQPTQSKNSQRSLGSVSYSKSTSNTKSKAKSSVASKSSIPKPSLKQARRNVISKSSEVPSVSNLQHSVVGKSNDGPITTSDVAMLGHASTFPDSVEITMDTTLAQSSCSKVGNTQFKVSRLGKPSGLRVPSPSIGYFSQSDSQPSHSAGDKHSQLPRSEVSASRVSLIPTFNKPQISEKVPGVNSKSGTGNIGSAASFSAQSTFLKPSQERMKVDLKSTRKIESKVSSCSLSSLINERLQHPSFIQGDTGKLVLDDVDMCTSEKVSTAKCDKVQSNSKLPPSGCKNNVQDGNMSDDTRDEKRKTCLSVEEHCAIPLKHGPVFQDSMDSSVHGPPADELALFNNCSQSKVSNPEEEEICTTNDFSGDFISLDVHGQPLNGCVDPGNEAEISPLLSGENDALPVNHSIENVVKQPEVLDSSTAVPSHVGDFASVKSDVDDLSSENQLGFTGSVFASLGPAEVPDCVQSPCNHLEENAVSNSVLCDHNMVCDGQAALETEKRIEVSDSTVTCEADVTCPFPDSKDWFRDSEEKHFSCQLVHEVKEGGKEIDVLIRNVRGDNGPDMQIDYFTSSPDVEQDMEQVKLVMPSSAEVRMEDRPLESPHEPFPEKRTSEEQKQYNCSSVAITSDVNAGCVMKQIDQLGTSDGCSPAKDASAAVFCYSNEEHEDNSELEDMDLVTESDSDEDPEEILELKEVHMATESELISNLDEFSVKHILNQEFPEVETIHTESDICGKTKTLLSGKISSSASIFGDPKRLDVDTMFSTISEGMLKEDSTSGRIEYNSVGKAKNQTDTEKNFNAHVTNQELGLHEVEDVQVVTISPDPIAFATREEESGTPVPKDDDTEPNELNLLSDGTLTSENNGDRASESSSSCTCSSEGIPLDAKLEKKPDPIIVKPPNAVPFSDEWLAAIEAAGEEILTLKSGRVQHSPTDKSAPEPSPWSPVKKKNNQGVGPFDCTKYTNKGLPPVLD